MIASIKPVHSLVAAVMAGVGKPDLLVPGAASPHEYTLRPSDAERLSHAQAIFWIGPMMESYLERPILALAGNAEVVQLSNAPGLRVLAQRKGGAWEINEDAPLPPAGEFAKDPHIWLDPVNVRALVALIASRLASIDADHATRYTSNAAALYRRLDALDQELRRKLTPLADRRFIVFHDAYQYLDRRYGLADVGSITISPDQQPGPRRIEEIRRKLRVSGARCLFVEPDSKPAMVKTVVEGMKIHTGVLDPEGLKLDPEPELYFKLMNGIAEALTACLWAP